MPATTEILTEEMVRKALDASMEMSIIRSHPDLEFLVSHWSTETHTLITSWGEFTPTLEDVSLMFVYQRLLMRA